MVNPGGKSTMLGHWRIALRQAEESARAGRFDEALALASRPDVADHRQAIQLRGRLAMDLVGRAGRRAEADDLTGAIADLNLAEKYGVAPDTLAAARMRLAERVAAEVRVDLDTGEPARVVERVETLAKQQIGGRPGRAAGPAPPPGPADRVRGPPAPQLDRLAMVGHVGPAGQGQRLVEASRPGRLLRLSQCDAPMSQHG